MTASTKSKTIRGSGTVGARAAEESAAPAGHDRLRVLRRAANSIALKLFALAVIFVLFPLLIYWQLREADQERRFLMLEAIQIQGQLIAAALRPTLVDFAGESLDPLQERLALFAESSGDLNVKILFRAQGSAEEQGFLYVASLPGLSPDYLDRERQLISETGLLGGLYDSCAGGRSLARQFTNPAGREELLTSITPINAPSGCWVVITSAGRETAARWNPDEPYWRTPEIQVALVSYLVIVAIVLSLFMTVRTNLSRFERLARTIGSAGRSKQSFENMNAVPELHGVAVQFDHMVRRLRNSTDIIRRTAEDNAHAFKAPIAVISQCLEPLRRVVQDGTNRERRAYELIERSVERLDDLISASWHLEKVAADMIEQDRSVVRPGRLLEAAALAYRPIAARRRVTMNLDSADDVAVVANPQTLSVAIENLIDNALDFTPPGGAVDLSVEARDGVCELTVMDGGPGVPDADLSRIFERYFSQRPYPKASGDGQDEDRRGAGSHLGLGLWIVRQTAEAFGGSVRARNRDGGGLTVTVELPLAKRADEK